MRIDIVSIFPEYLAALDLSLVGKARVAGLLDLRVHDLRDWTTDRHRTVDDTPFGGVRDGHAPRRVGQAIDELTGTGPAHLVVPTPSGATFTSAPQRPWRPRNSWSSPAGGTRIDARVAEHYRAAGHRVSELSIGDYVLNGGRWPRSSWSRPSRGCCPA
ncbi:hypothetical protein NKG05_01310 [Oerskovia sp. M15]